MAWRAAEAISRCFLLLFKVFYGMVTEVVDLICILDKENAPRKRPQVGIGLARSLCPGSKTTANGGYTKRPCAYVSVSVFYREIETCRSITR